MARGYQTEKEHRDAVAGYGKILGKRAGFCCEWCGGKEELRPWEYRQGAELDQENLALLCSRCRSLADGGRADTYELHALRNALWSTVPAIAEGAARVILRANPPWAREAVEESLIDDAVKQELLT